MPAEIDPSSFRCDCGYRSDHFVNTITELKKKSLRRPQRLDFDDDAHSIVFEKGRMTAMWCPKAGKDLPVKDL